MKDLKYRAKKLKSEIPAVFIALKKKETPVIANIFAGNLWRNGKPKWWYFATPIILIWVVIILPVIKLARS